MNQTTNYKLNQWDAADPIRREDFNSDNAIIDAALGGQEARVETLEAACAKSGSCVFYSATYTGNGETATVPTHTFPHKPMVVMVATVGSAAYNTIFWRGQTHSRSFGTTYSDVEVTWNGNTVTWHSENDLGYGMNQKDTVYQIVALLDMSE